MSTCKRHPERPARRRCFHCQAPICPSCQIVLDHHIFCAHACHLAWRRRARRAAWSRRWRAAQAWFDPRIWWRYPPFRRQDWARRAMLAVWALLALNLATAAVLWQSQHSAGGPAARPTAGAALAVAPQWLDGPRVVDGRVEATAAGGGAGATVLQNGTIVAELAPQEVRELRLTAPTGPANWRLLPRGADAASERWTWPAAAPTPVDQVRQAPGIALTFDGGAHVNMLQPILDVLRRKRETATFFLTGEFVARYPHATRQIAAGGHEVGNHTWSHAHLTSFERNRRHDTLAGVDRPWLQWELLRTQHLFRQTTGLDLAPLWRAPYGEVNDELIGWAQELGYRHVGWTSHGSRTQSLDTLDWVDDPNDPLYVSGNAMAERIVQLATQPRFRGGIVLMHVGTQRRADRIQDQLAPLIDRLRAEGLALRTVSELIAGG